MSAKAIASKANYNGPPVGKLKDPHSGAAAATREAKTRSLPVVEGEWTAPGFFEITAGEHKHKIAYSHGHLKKKYGGGPGSLASISDPLWHHWIKRDCLELGRRILAFRAKNSKVNRPDGKGRRWVTVWLADDVSTICKAWTEPNRSPAGYKGRWITSDVWEDDEWGNMLLDADIAKHTNRGQSWVSERRQEQHEVLGGRAPRFRYLPALVEGETSRDKRLPVHVSVLDDYKKIEEQYQRDPVKKLPTQQPQDKLTAEQIGQHIGVTEKKDRIVLGFVLHHFRDKHPDQCEPFAVTRKERKRRLNQATAWAYDFDAFRRWRGRKTFKELKAEFEADRKPSAKNVARADQKLARAVRFFQFVLTHGEFTPESFGRFLAHLPKGELQPSKPVQLAKIWEWAFQAGLTWKQLNYTSTFLSAAMKEAGVKVKREWNKRFCYFSGPISLQTEQEAAPPSVTESKGSPKVDTVGDAKPGKKRGGKPRSPEAEEVQKYCYEQLSGLIVTMIPSTTPGEPSTATVAKNSAWQEKKLIQIWHEIMKLYGDDRAPSEEANVRLYAVRFAEKYKLPTLPKKRAKS